MAHEPRKLEVDGVPVLLVPPPDDVPPRSRLALWITHLSGTKEDAVPQLRRLAARGFHAATLDPWRHGARAADEPVGPAVFGAFRRNMWVVQGRTILDAVAVIDALLARHGLSDDVVAGGFSMGGDITVALAGADARVSAVAALVASPDWTRPGMRRLFGPDEILDQGEPTALGRWFYERLDPMTHLDAYARAPRILFELGAADTHVPPANASAFVAELRERHPAAADAVTIHLMDGLGHLEAMDDPGAAQRAVEFLSA